MADILRIKRRISGAPGAPASLANAELAYNEVDHILYYGEGTGGAGGTATAISAIAGQGLAYTTAPAMNGTAAAGSQGLWSRGDHVHPSDTAKANVASPTFTGAVTISGTIGGAGITSLLAPYAKIDSQIFTGTPSLPTGTTAITQANTANNTTLATTAFVRSIRLDQLAVPTAAVSMNGQSLTNLPLNPTNASDAASKSYVDQNSAGLVAKGAAACATTGANITLSGLQTIDGYTTLANDRVLVKDQTTQANNGIYVAGSGAWTRATDMDAWVEVPQAYVFVSNGTVNAASSWVCSSAIGGTLGTTPITWVQFSQQAQITAGGGLIRTGNNVDVVGTSGRILVNADSIDIDPAYVGQTSLTTLGTITTGFWSGTTIAVNRGGTGTTTLTGYVKGNGTAAFTASASIPNTDISGLGSMATQNAAAVAITGGTIDNVVFDMGTF